MRRCAQKYHNLDCIFDAEQANRSGTAGNHNEMGLNRRKEHPGQTSQGPDNPEFAEALENTTPCFGALENNSRVISLAQVYGYPATTPASPSLQFVRPP
jgi:hypothetical protein